MIGLAIPVLLLVAGIVLAVAIAIRRSRGGGEDRGDGSDIVSYLILALAMGVAGFAIAELANTAFPGDRLVFDPADNLATSLAAIAVSAPFLVYFWRRQADRRALYPASTGWTLYLTVIEAVFMTAFITAAVLFVNGLISDEPASAWTGTLVFGVILLFHELAVWRDPPRSDANELPRVVGSALGLLTLVIGASGTLTAVFSLPFDSLDFSFHPWLAMLMVGAPVWGYRWVRPWDGQPSVPRLTWSTVVTIATTALAIGSATTLLVLALQYLLADVPVPSVHFALAPGSLAVLTTAAVVWFVHRRTLGNEQSAATRAYQYATAALGLLATVGAAIALTIIAFDDSLLVGGGTQDVIAAATTMVVGILAWRGFTRRASSGEPEREEASWPRRLYHLGFGIGFGLGAAGALVTSLFIIFRRLLDEGETGSLLTPLTVFVYTALAAWYLLSIYARDRKEIEDETVLTPFDVTLVTSHPGSIATRFPKQARLQVIYRGDDIGVISEEIADAIVKAVANRSSLVWVDEDGFRVAPKRDVS